MNRIQGKDFLREPSMFFEKACNHRWGISAFGKANMDVVAKVSEQFISEHNFQKAVDNIVAEQDLLDLVNNLSHPQRMPGGSAANTAAGFAAMGGTAAYFGRVGSDIDGKAFGSSLTENKIYVSQKLFSGIHTSLCVVLLTPDGQRTFVVSPSTICPVIAEEVDWDVATQSQILHVEGKLSFTDAGREVLLRCAKIREDNGSLISLNMPPANRLLEHTNELNYATEEYCDVVFGNNREFAAWQGTENIELLTHRMSLKPFTCVITLGSSGVVVVNGGKTQYFQSIMVDKVVDESGAGDQFAAGFLYTYLETHSIRLAVEAGIHTGGMAVREYGARPKNKIGSVVQSLKT